MTSLSLLLNIAVLVPVSLGLLADAAWVRAAYGDRTPARGILLSIYLAILAVSALALILGDPRATAALLLVQVVYKSSTPLTVGTLRNPVVMSNIGIAIFHGVTLGLMRWA